MLEKKIYLWDYLLRELRKWKLIVLVSILCGVLITALGHIRSKRSYDAAVKTIELEYSDIDEQIKTVEKNMTDENIDNAVKYCDKERSLQSQEEYINNSILMTLDGNNLHEANYAISIEYQGNDVSGDKTTDMVGVISAALNNDDFLKAVRDELYPDKNASYILELIELKRNGDSQDINIAASMIYPTIIIPNDRNVADCDKVVNSYVQQLDSNISNYKIEVIDSNEAYVSDVSIITKQRDTYNYVDNYRAKLSTDKSNLTSDEKRLADFLIAKEKQENGLENKTSKQDAINELEKPGISKKYAFAGVFLGIVFVMGVDFVSLIFTTKTNTMEEICSYFSIKPLLVNYNNQDKSFLINSKVIYNWQYKKYADADKQTDNYIRQVQVLSKEDGVEEIELLTCHVLDDKDIEYIDRLKETTGKAGVKLVDKEAEFIGKIDTSSQLKGSTPIILYVRQKRTNIMRLADVRKMAEKNNREIIGFMYVDC